MASIVLSSVGTSIGNMVLPGVGGRLLGSVGKKYGKEVDQAWGWGSSGVKDGARLENFKVQDSRYGLALPVFFGRVRVAGNVIWASDLMETAHETEVSGGKGGIVSSSVTRTTYTYSLNLAVALGAGEIGGIATIWADSKVIYQNGVWKSGVLAGATFYRGTEEQGVDPLLEAWIGAGLTPAYKGIAYVVLEGLQLSCFGNRLPSLTFEVLPLEPTGKPEWLGMAEPDMNCSIVTNRNRGMPPLIIEGGSLSARRMIVGGYAVTGLLARFVVVEYDVTGEAPVEVARVESESFSGEDVGDHSWALAADNRFVVCGLQDGASGKPYTVMIYDARARQFGKALTVSMPMMETRQAAWIDAQRFLIMDYAGDARGVRVFMRSGLDVVDLGYSDVWGAGSKLSRVPEMYAQFIPYADGLLHFVVDAAPQFTLMEGRHLSWKDNALVVGEKFNLLSGVSAGTGNGGQAFFLRSGEEAWTFLYATTIDIRLMSFVPGKDGVSVTRNWATLKNAAFGVALCHAPVIVGDRVVLLQRANYETQYRVSEIALGASGFSLVADGIALDDFSLVGASFGAALIDSMRLLVSVNAGTMGDLGRLDIIKRRNTGDTLDHVVGEILLRSGYVEADFDVTALAGIAVDGYVLAEQATGESALEILQVLEPFDLVERGERLVAVRREGGAGVDVAATELGAREEEGEAETETLLSLNRLQETDLPMEVSVSYEDPTRDYETGYQKARRGSRKGARGVLKLVLPLVCSASRAKRVAERHLYTLWGERTAYRFALSRAGAGFEPGDVVRVGDVDMRVSAVRMENGVVRVDAVSAFKAEEGSSVADGGAAQGCGLASGIATTLYLMDLPLLRGEDDQPGVYVAASGLDGWPGATLWRAADGVSFSQQAVFDKAATAGVAVDALASAETVFMDRASLLRVQLLRGGLSSCSQADLLNGANAALVGAEIVQFQTATLLGPGLYELSGLLRGRKGTEGAVGSHAVGESFVLLSSAAIQFLPMQISDRKVSANYRAVTSGGSLALAMDLAMAPALRTLEPLAVCHLRGAREGGDLTLSWVRRARKNAAWVDYIDVPLDEAAECYDVDIMDVETGSVVRCFTDLGEAGVVYTSAMMAEDFGALPPETVRVDVYQKSGRYGRGQGATAVV